MNRTTTVTLTNMCMVYDHKGNVLVEEKAGGLIFPGGHVENAESIVDSTIREIKEETGLIISDLEFCGIKDWLEKDGSRYGSRYIVFLYKTNKFSGKLIPSDEGNVYWMPLEELKKKEPLWHLDKMLEIFCGNGVSELYFDGTEVMLK